MTVTSENAREWIAKHGKTASQKPNAWKGTFAIPESLVRYYDEIGPVNINIESYGNSFHLPRLSQLWKFQAGYRWNGVTNEPIADWNDDWLVVGDQGGDPLIFSRATGEILFAEHGAGRWEPKPLFPDLTAMAACLGMLGEIVVAAGDGFTDDRDRIVREHRNRAIETLQEALGSKSKAQNVLKILGWA